MDALLSDLTIVRAHSQQKLYNLFPAPVPTQLILDAIPGARERLALDVPLVVHSRRATHVHLFGAPFHSDYIRDTEEELLAFIRVAVAARKAASPSTAPHPDQVS
jgi:hypothetical protein